MKKRPGPKPRPRLVTSLSLPPQTTGPRLDDWKSASVLALDAAGAVAIPGDTRLALRIGLPLSRRPLGGIVAPIVAVLVAAGTVDDAESVTDWSVRYDRTIPTGIVRLDLRGTTPAGKRIDAKGRANVARAQRARHRKQQPAEVAA